MRRLINRSTVISIAFLIALYLALTGGLTNEFYRPPNVRQLTIRVRLEEQQRRHLGDLTSLFITTPGGRSTGVPASQLPARLCHRDAGGHDADDGQFPKALR